MNYELMEEVVMAKIKEPVSHNVKFEEAGEYAAQIFVNQELMGELSLTVKET